MVGDLPGEGLQWGSWDLGDTAELEVTKVLHDGANGVVIHETGYHTLPKGSFPASLPFTLNEDCWSTGTTTKPTVSPLTRGVTSLA